MVNEFDTVYYDPCGIFVILIIFSSRSVVLARADGGWRMNDVRVGTAGDDHLCVPVSELRASTSE